MFFLIFICLQLISSNKNDNFIDKENNEERIKINECQKGFFLNELGKCSECSTHCIKCSENGTICEQYDKEYEISNDKNTKSHQSKRNLTKTTNLNEKNEERTNKCNLKKC